MLSILYTIVSIFVGVMMAVMSKMMYAMGEKEGAILISFLAAVLVVGGITV